MTAQIEQRKADGIDRRAIPPTIDRRQSADDKALLALVQIVHDDVQKLKIKVDEVRTDESLALAEAVSDLMLKAFPEGDAMGHKAAHEAEMAAILDRAEFWRKMRFELSRAGLLGFLAWAGIQLWNGVLAGPKS